MRFYLFLFFTILILYASLKKPYLGTLVLIGFYYMNPNIWGPEWFRPVHWISATTILSVSWHQKKIQIGSIGWAMIVLLVGLWISADYAIASQNIAKQYWHTLLLLFFAYYVFYNITLLDTKQFVVLFLWLNLAGVLYMSKAAIYYYLTVSNIQRIDAVGGQGGGANFFAMLIDMILYFVICQLISSNKKIHKLLFMLIIGILLFSLILTGSRAGFLGLILVILSIIKDHSRRNFLKAILIVASLGIAFVMFVPDYFWERMATTIHYEEEASASDRIVEWSAAMELFSKHPFIGIGPNNFYLVSHKLTGIVAGILPNGQPHGLVTHNMYFQLLCEGGLLSFIPFCIIVGISYFRLRLMSLSRSSSDDIDNTLVIGSIKSAFVIFLFCGIFGSILHRDIFYWLLGIINGLYENKYA